jgi:hypothetical protein
MKTATLLLLTLPLMAQNYASYNNQPVSRMSFLRHQFKPSQNALRDSSLIGYWPLSEGAGTVAFDESGNGDAGNWFSTPAGTNGYYSAGKTATFSGNFNNIANRINLTAPFSITGPLTYTAWFNSIGLSGAHMFIGDTDVNGLKVGGNTGKVFVRLYNGGTIENSNGPVVANVWYLIAVTRDSTGNMVTYLNGSAISTIPGQASMSSPTYLGSPAPSGGQPWAGLLQGVRIYNRALSGSEILALYNGENH